MNKLNEMNIADLSSQEVDKLMNFEKDFNNNHNSDEVFVLVLKK